MNATTSATMATRTGATLGDTRRATAGMLRVLGVALPLIAAPLLWWGAMLVALRMAAGDAAPADGDRRLGAWGREAGEAAWPHTDAAVGAIGAALLLLAGGGCCRLLRRQRTWGGAFGTPVEAPARQG